MAININGRISKVPVSPGPEGRAAFVHQLRQLMGVESTGADDDDGFCSVVFDVNVPTDGAPLRLSGLEAWDAAVHCAAINAARRQQSAEARKAAAAAAAATSAASAASAATPPGQVVPASRTLSASAAAGGSGDAMEEGGGAMQEEEEEEEGARSGCFYGCY
jgi:hypothetical protein